MWEQRLLGRAGVRVWMSCMASVTSSVVTGAQRMERLFPALSSRTVLVLMGSCSGLSPDLSGAKFSLVMPSEDVQGEHLPFLECCLHHHYYSRENSLRFCFLSEITNTHPKDSGMGSARAVLQSFAVWDGERVKEEGMELRQKVWKECPAHPSIGAVPAGRAGCGGTGGWDLEGG